MPEEEVEVLLDTTGGSGGRPIDLDRLRFFPRYVEWELSKSAAEIGFRILKAVAIAYEIAIRERPRLEGEYLKTRLNQALTRQWTQNAEQVIIEVFDLFKIDELTRNEGFRTQDRGWFLLYESGQEYRTHGSYNWGFVPLQFAVNIASKVSHSWPAERKAEFLADVKENFKGRHGDGIMVHLDRPLFYKFPELGTGREWGFEPHPGFMPYNILARNRILKDLQTPTGESWMTHLLDRAFDRAAGRLFK